MPPVDFYWDCSAAKCFILILQMSSGGAKRDCVWLFAHVTVGKKTYFRQIHVVMSLRKNKCVGGNEAFFTSELEGLPIPRQEVEGPIHS